MKKLRLAIVAIVFLCSLPWRISELRTLWYLQKQTMLADILEVNIRDYRPIDFPNQYFSKTLKPGMSIDNVHKIAKGYSKVYKCQDWAEIYFYFSEDDKKAFKYQMLYDNGKYESFITDDIYNSMGVSTDSCVEGLLGE